MFAPAMNVRKSLAKLDLWSTRQGPYSPAETAAVPADMLQNLRRLLYTQFRLHCLLSPACLCFDGAWHQFARIKVFV